MIGNLYVQVDVLTIERTLATKSQAKNVMIFSEDDARLLDSKIESKWLINSIFKIRKSNQKLTAFDLGEKIFQKIDLERL